MPRGYQKLELDAKEVKSLMDGAKNKEEFRRIQALHLRISENMPAPSIAKITGFSLEPVVKLELQNQ